VSDETSERSGSSLKWILGGAALVSVTLGFGGYWRYSQSEAYVAVGIERMEAQGPQLDVDGCMEAVLGWHHDCDINGANASVCQAAIGMTMLPCLRGADRTEECVPYGEQTQSHGVWVWKACIDRGTRCFNKRECPCAEAYRAIDSFCRNGGEAVQL
jgi:hypothetical protein